MNALEDLRALNSLPPDNFWLSASSVPPSRHTRSACRVNGSRPHGMRRGVRRIAFSGHTAPPRERWRYGAC